METLEEIAMEAVASFKESGGDHCEVVPCANDSPEHIRLIHSLVKPYIKEA